MRVASSFARSASTSEMSVRHRLTELLGHHAHDLPAVSNLSEDHQRELADVLDDAFTQQDSKIDAALERVVSGIPRPLRGRVTKLLFPENDR